MNSNYLREALAKFDMSLSEWLKLENRDEIVDEILEFAFEQFARDLADTIDAYINLDSRKSFKENNDV